MEYSKDNTMTRKEYLKSKKKNKIDYSKLKYVLLIIVVILLGIYVFKQLKIYNNVTQIANKVVEETKLAKTMTMYYVSDSYTKDGNSIVMLYKSSDESRTKIEGTDGLVNIKVVNDKLYGIDNKTLYEIDLITMTKNKIATNLEKTIDTYFVTNEKIYIATKDGVYVLEENLQDAKKIINHKVQKMVVFGNEIFCIAQGKTNQSIIKYNLNGANKTVVSEKYIVKDFFVTKDKIYFVNSKDSKIYSVTKTGNKIKKITDSKIKANTSIAFYQNNAYYINASDNNTLYKIDLTTNKQEQVIKKNIESIQIDDTIIYYKLYNNLGIYKYEVLTNKTTQITSIRSKEYICKN